MKPLARTTRRRFFWTLVVLFIIGTPLLIGYSKGYRIDDALSLIQTGGIYIHSDRQNATVYIDNEYVETTGTFLRNTYIQNLLPNRTYTVWLVRDGYQSWTKTLPVYPNLVTEAYVLMMPAVFEWTTVLATSTVDISASATSTGDVDSASSTLLVVANPEYTDLKEFFGAYKDQFAVEVATSTYIVKNKIRIATTTTVIEYQFPTWLSLVASTTELALYTMVRERDGILAWLDDGDLYATWVRPQERMPYFFCTATCTSTVIIDWVEPITRFEFYPGRNDVVLVGSKRGVYAVELDTRSQENIQTVIEEPNIDFRLLLSSGIAIFDGTMFKKTSW